MNSSYYPAGAYNDPSAPYNQPDDSCITDQARELAYKDCDDDCRFWDWLTTEYGFDYDDEHADALCLEYRDKEEVFNKYFEFDRDYYEQKVIDQYAEEPECDYEDY